MFFGRGELRTGGLQRELQLGCAWQREVVGVRRSWQREVRDGFGVKQLRFETVVFLRDWETFPNKNALSRRWKGFWVNIFLGPS